MELLKYAPDNISEIISENLNNMIEKQENKINIGQSILLPTPKPGKEQGPLKNLRPLNLLNSIRKFCQQ